MGSFARICAFKVMFYKHQFVGGNQNRKIYWEDTCQKIVPNQHFGESTAVDLILYSRKPFQDQPVSPFRVSSSYQFNILCL